MNHPAAPWRADALCARPMVLHLLGLVSPVIDVGVDPWFAEKGHPAAHAKRVCNSCPVKADCLSWALTPPVEAFGVWGGAGESVRRSLRNLLLASPHLKDAGPRPGCRCGFCRAVDGHFRRLDVFARRGRFVDGRVTSFGAGASHGRQSTHARGCRCPACRAVRTFGPWRGPVDVGLWVLSRALVDAVAAAHADGRELDLAPDGSRAA